MLLGLIVGLILGIIAAILIPLVADQFTFWGVFFLTVPVSILAAVMMAALIRPENALLMLTKRLPDEFVFPAWVFLAWSGLVIALYAAPDFNGIKNSVLRGSSSSTTSLPDSGFSAPDRLCVLIVITMFAGLCIVVWLLRSGNRFCVLDVRLNEAESTSIFEVGRDEMARNFFAQTRNKTTAEIAKDLLYSEETVCALVAYQKRKSFKP